MDAVLEKQLGTVQQVSGLLKVKRPDGSEQVLLAGDAVNFGDVLSAEGGSVLFNLSNGRLAEITAGQTIDLGNEPTLEGLGFNFNPLDKIDELQTPAAGEPLTEEFAEISSVTTEEPPLPEEPTGAGQPPLPAEPPGAGVPQNSGLGSGESTPFGSDEVVVQYGFDTNPLAFGITPPPDDQPDLFNQGGEASVDSAPANGTPTTGENEIVSLDDEELEGGIAGGVGDDPDAPLNLTGILSHSFGADGADSITWNQPADGNGFTYSLSNNVLSISQNGVLVLTATLNPATGEYSIAQEAPIDHGAIQNENDLLLSLGYVVTDGDGDTATGTLALNLDDDMPVVGENAVVQLDDELLTGGNTGGVGDDPDAPQNLTGTLNHNFGADGVGSIAWNQPADGNGFTYSLSNNVLSISQNGVLVLTATLNPATGEYSIAQAAPIDHGAIQNENDLLLSLGYVITDGDGDTSTGTLALNLDDDMPQSAPTIDDVKPVPPFREDIVGEQQDS